MKIHCSLQLNSAYVKNFDALGGRLCIFVALFGGDTWQTFGHLLAQLVAGCKVRKSTEKPGRRWKKFAPHHLVSILSAELSHSL